MVRRPFPSRGLATLDPLLMLDEMGPVDYGPDEAVGAPDHPHRGFETVTYLLAGEGTHADSAGHTGTLRPGDVQWMTAGAGVIHREMPSPKIQREGGRVHGFQLWVNLPRAHKMTRPRYQEIPRESIPKALSDDGLASVQVIAGDALGASAVIATHTPIVLHHWRFQPGAEVDVALAEDHNVGVYVFDGVVQVAGRDVSDGQIAVLGPGQALQLGSRGVAQALLLGGRPLREPVAWMGPFVMNTEDEIRQAMLDYQQGRMGSIPPQIVKPSP